LGVERSQSQCVFSLSPPPFFSFSKKGEETQVEVHAETPEPGWWDDEYGPRLENGWVQGKEEKVAKQGKKASLDI
jgi:hypothetical protein